MMPAFVSVVQSFLAPSVMGGVHGATTIVAVVIVLLVVPEAAVW